MRTLEGPCRAIVPVASALAVGTYGRNAAMLAQTPNTSDVDAAKHWFRGLVAVFTKPATIIAGGVCGLAGASRLESMFRIVSGWEGIRQSGECDDEYSAHDGFEDFCCTLTKKTDGQLRTISMSASDSLCYGLHDLFTAL